MNINLKNKTAIITGASAQGLGRAHALSLGKAGCNIAILDIANCDETLALLQKDGITAKAYSCDISNMDAVASVAKNVLADFKTVDVIVNNAGIYSTVGMFCDIPVDKWNRDIAINLIGAANVTRAFWPELIKNNWGRVVFISSYAGTHGGAGQTSYAATKAGLIGLAKSLALEGARYNITANVVAPGVIESQTAMTGIREDMLDRMKKKSPLRRFGKPEEVSNAVTFLASEQASYITGQVLEVEGGMGLFVF